MAEKYTAAQVIEAIRGSRGIVSNAARKLGCSRKTIYNYIDRYATVAEALEEEREDLLDFVEDRLLREIDHGNMTAIIFYLKTRGKHRGYVERQEVTGADGGALNIVVRWPEQDADADD